MNVGRTLVLVVIVALLVAAGFAGDTSTVQALLRRWSYTKSVERDSGTYYRLNVKLVYRGAPLNFDIVVGCNVKITRSMDNDRTVEVGILPMAYGLKMTDGRGVVVKPPQACGGETTANGKVPAALLPLVVTYQNADEPWFGLAYASDDAYESPRSEMKFLGATISEATKPQWEEWRRVEAPKNFLTFEVLGINPKNPWDQIRWRIGDRFMGTRCHAAARVKLADAVRAPVNAKWPVDRPTYWHTNEEVKRILRGRPAGNVLPEWLFDDYRFEQYLSHGASQGLPRLKAGAVMYRADDVAGAIYPARTDFTPNLLGPDGRLPPDIAAKTNVSWTATEVLPELRGFAYCDTLSNVTGFPSYIDWQLNLGRTVNRINGELIQEAHEDGGGRTRSGAAIERDEYVYFFREYELVNILGGL
ncbi:hypothetical protein [Bradyrhizobium sp. HKCCYLS20291]|uniref:hypothetical protein n=1 Tax=Bradyrhizobium sp. HKCCYLS20291 TaxID=3420766 RepID=UPI003EB7BBEA